MFAFIKPLADIAGIILKVLLELVALVLRFFTTPPEQIASKLIAVVLALTIGGIVGDFYRGHEDRIALRQREADHAHAMEQLREGAAEDARAEVKEAQDKEKADAFNVAKQIEVYAQAVPRPDPGACRLTGADLRAAGVRNDNVDVGRNPGRLQRRPQAGRSR